uniref:Uncharacterized protein n=1 Tax=Anguilla anguilla TaxID=7936 RepID=A0A0E9VVL0_ANGAN
MTACIQHVAGTVMKPPCSQADVEGGTYRRILGLQAGLKATDAAGLQ